jgi:phosphoglycolate phosphatase
VFDLDGTLVDSVPGIEHAMKAALAEVVPGTALPSLRSLLGPPVRDVAARVVPGASEDVLDRLVAGFRRAYDAGMWSETESFAGASHVVESLAASGVRVFVATNKPFAATKAILGAHGFLEHLEDVVAPDAVSPPYADKASMLRYLARTHGLPVARTVMVGDSAEDAVAARGAGMAFVAALWGYGKPQEGAEPPAPEAHDLPGLLALLSGDDAAWRRAEPGQRPL